MFRGRRGRSRGFGGGARGGARGGRPTTSAKGLFADNIWHCDCTPRLPAEHFKVKKEGKNQGRWFYTCQQSQDSGKRCGFFLWDEDAKMRMEATVMSNKRTEVLPDPDVQDGWNAGRNTPFAKGMFGRNDRRSRQSSTDDDRTASPTPTGSSRTAGGVKRNARIAHMDEDDDLFGDLTGLDEAEMAKVADAVEPQTPQKAQRTGVYATPATSAKRKLPWLEEPITPVTARKRSNSPLETPSKTPTACKTGVEVGNQPQTPQTLGLRKETSPTPSRYKDALNNPEDSASSLTSEALAVLASTSLPPDVLSTLRGVLTKHDLKSQGVRKGRDITRLALKAKDAKLVELQARISSLEAERDLDKALVRKLRRDVEHGAGSTDEEL